MSPTTMGAAGSPTSHSRPQGASGRGTETLLDRLIPHPRLLEIDRVDLAAPPEATWDRVRHGSFASSRLAKALFAIRTLPDRVLGVREGGTTQREITLRVDDLVSSARRPGFQVLLETPNHEVAVGAIGKVWMSRIPFLHVLDANEYAAFDGTGYVKVAWSFRVAPYRGGSHLEMEVRVDATDEESWRRFRRYFRVIGPASRFLRRSSLAALAGELGHRTSMENSEPLAGDELLPDAADQLTHTVDVAATPQRIWPWLVQMGCNRGGFYSIDVLDNAGKRSAREIHPELQRLRVGELIPARPDGEAGFEVLRIDRPRCLVLGGLWDHATGVQLPFGASRPARYQHMTWSFVLESLDGRSTRVHARARVAYSDRNRFQEALGAPVHDLMERAQLHNLAARVEGRQSLNDLRDILHGLRGIVRIAGAFLTPFRRKSRAVWGVGEESASRGYPGDSLIPRPSWSWTHGVEIEASAKDVWPWVAQLGADRAGFYSYQWLENLAACRIQNAETVHPLWEIDSGDPLVLHPKLPPFRVVAKERERYFIAHVPLDGDARRKGMPWVEASWLFQVEPIGPNRCRLVSRYRVHLSGEWRNRIAFGPGLLEPIGSVMDREMLLGVKRRAEETRARAT